MSATIGWGNPRPMSRVAKFHYFGADGRSLCGRWLMLNTSQCQDTMHDHPDNCATCKVKHAKATA